MAPIWTAGAGIYREKFSAIYIQLYNMSVLTHYGLETPYGDTYLGQHWLR